MLTDRMKVLATVACGAVMVLAIAFAMAPTSCFGLSSGRTYEMVSPPFKGGFGALEVEGVATSGDSVLFYSPGAFAGAPSGATLGDYVARREAGGWSTVPVMPPLTVLATMAATDFSPSLEQKLETGYSGENSEDTNPGMELWLHDTHLPDLAADWQHVATIEEKGTERSVLFLYRGADDEFCRFVGVSNDNLLPPLTTEGHLQSYEYYRGCFGEETGLKMIGVDNHTPIGLIGGTGCAVEPGIASTYAAGGLSEFNAVSADGDVVFFTDCVAGEPGADKPHQLFARLAGARTIEVSRPPQPTQPFDGCVRNKVRGEVPCDGAAERASADFAGASEDGSHVYFMTRAALTADDKDSSNDLYMADIGCPPGGSETCEADEREVVSMTRVSRAANSNEVADVQGVVRVAPDGSRVYFVARGDLLSRAQREALQSEGRGLPAAGADNLYVYDATTGSIAFVGDLCESAFTSGTVEDVHCPNTNTGESRFGNDRQLWLGGQGEAQTAGSDGRCLVFSTYAQLTRDDTDDAKDVYRYNAQTGSLERVSIGEHGYDANGNRDDGNEPSHYVNGELVEGTEASADATIVPGHLSSTVHGRHEMDSRAISEDGAHVVFVTADPLSASASNGTTNVYEWTSGSEAGSTGDAAIVSTGSAEAPTEQQVISADGRNVFFQTVEKLLPQDTDSAADIYDARVGGDFAEGASQRRPCEGDGCQGPLTNPAPLLTPGTAVQEAGGNFPVVKHKSARAKKKAKRKRKRRGARHSRRQRAHRSVRRGAGR